MLGLFALTQLILASRFIEPVQITGSIHTPFFNRDTGPQTDNFTANLCDERHPPDDLSECIVIARVGFRGIFDMGGQIRTAMRFEERGAKAVLVVETSPLVPGYANTFFFLRVFSRFDLAFKLSCTINVTCLTKDTFFLLFQFLVVISALKFYFTNTTIFRMSFSG
jgi:hypothetical protein